MKVKEKSKTNSPLTGKFPESRARDIFRQVGSAVSYLHRRGMIHRDIKAENVFFTSRDHILLGDFGFAKRLDSMEQHLTTFCGSPPYAAPELFVVSLEISILDGKLTFVMVLQHIFFIVSPFILSGVSYFLNH